MVVVGLFSGIYHLFLLERDQLKALQTTTATTSVGVIGIQLRLKILEAAILNYDYDRKGDDKND